MRVYLLRYQRPPSRIGYIHTWLSPCTTRPLRRGSRSTSTTAVVQASSITNYQLPYRSPTAHRIRLSMPLQRRQQQLFSRTFCRRKHNLFRLWLNKRVGLVCLPDFNIQATIRPDLRSAGELPSKSLPKREQM